MILRRSLLLGRFVLGPLYPRLKARMFFPILLFCSAIVGATVSCLGEPLRTRPQDFCVDGFYMENQVYLTTFETVPFAWSEKEPLSPEFAAWHDRCIARGRYVLEGWGFPRLRDHAVFRSETNFNCWRLPVVRAGCRETMQNWVLHAIQNRIDCSRMVQSSDRNPRPELVQGSTVCDVHSISGCLVGFPRQSECPDEKNCSEAAKRSREPRSKHHTLSGSVHGLCSIVHALLGNKVVYLSLAAFGFFALAGRGGFLAFDKFNRDGKDRAIGKFFLIRGIGAGLLLGLQ